MSRMLVVLISICIALVSDRARAAGWICNHADEYCGAIKGNRSTSTPAYPTTSSGFKLNPAAVPVEKGLGVETLMYKGQFDFALVKGLGRVGAAISPSNNEETFFGPPGFETTPDFVERKELEDKYASQKYTLAGAFNVLSNKKRGLSRIDINLGVIGKYNRQTGSAWPGGGISGIAGPFTFGYSVYKDEYKISFPEEMGISPSLLRYKVETSSVGIFLTNLAVDYSVLRLFPEDVTALSDPNDPSVVSVLTASLIFSRGMLTVSQRTEESSRPVYDRETKQLLPDRKKTETFVSAQVSATDFLMIGAFYNYYLLNEVSLGATLFF